MADTYTVQRSIFIDAPADAVYAHIIDFHRWDDWSPWVELDPGMDTTYWGPQKGPGAKYAWSGNRKVGQGSMEITGATEPSEVQIALEFLKPFKASNTTEFSLQPTDGGTTVTWTMKGTLTLLTRIMGVFKSMDSMVGPDFERGLGRLKETVETKAG